MKKEVIIVLAEDDSGHAMLVTRNLKRAGVTNEILNLVDGQKTLNFFQKNGEGPHMNDGASYILLLDIRMPMVDGIEVLEQLRQDSRLKNIPVIVLTTTGEPQVIDRCHSLGCIDYIVKPVEYEIFEKTMKQLGDTLLAKEIPKLTGETV